MNKPVYFAGVSGILVVAISILNVILSFIFGLAGVPPILLGIINIIFSLAMLVFGAFFYWGFIVMGKTFNAKLLKVMAWIGFILIIIVGVFSFFSGIFSIVAQQNFLTGNILFEPFNETFMNESALSDIINVQAQNEITSAVTSFIVLFLAIFIVIALVLGAFTILFGAGILKLKEHLKYAKVTGILNIVAGATYIILIGFLIQLVAYAFDIVLLFEASKKIEK